MTSLIPKTQAPTAAEPVPTSVEAAGQPSRASGNAGGWRRGDFATGAERDNALRNLMRRPAEGNATLRDLRQATQAASDFCAGCGMLHSQCECWDAVNGVS